MKASIQHADRRKVIALVLIDFVFNATLSLKLWDAFINFALPGKTSRPHKKTY